MPSASVVVVGSGPVGLWLALELRRASVDVLVVDRRASRDDRDGHSRALNMSAGSLASLDARGLAAPFLAEGRPLPKMHFGLLATLLRLDEQILGLRHPYNLVIPQARTEALLLRLCDDAGVRFAWGVDVCGVSESADSVTATATNGTEISARWLVGCDGTHSAVRAAAGIAFEGLPATVTGMLADTKLETLPPDYDGWGLRRTAKGACMLVPMGDGLYRWVGMLRGARDVPASQPPSLDEIRGHVRDAYGSDLGLHSPHWLSRFGNACRVAVSFRAGRVLLAGDAAHQLLPAGGQGMNLGLQDASNLAWKLVRAVSDPALADRLLDSYSHERVPAALAVRDNVLAQLALLLAETPHDNALRAVLEESLREPHLNELWALRVTGFGDPREPYRLADDDDQLVGARLTHLEVGTPGPDGDALSRATTRADRFALVLRLDQADARFDRLRAEASRWPDAMTVLAETTRALDSRWDGVEAVLVRPDGRVAWVGRRDTRAESLISVLEYWLGDAGQKTTIDDVVQ